MKPCVKHIMIKKKKTQLYERISSLKKYSVINNNNIILDVSAVY